MTTIRTKQSTLIASGLLLACTFLAPASRACVSAPNAGQLPHRGFLPTDLFISPSAGAQLGESSNRDRQGQDTIVGMWIVTFYAGAYTGPNTQIYDRTIQQFFSDGNELMSSASFSPLLGNVCFGVWKEIERRTFRLKHIGWTFTTVGTFEGTARIDATMTVAPNGDTYVGAYTADVIDNNGNVVPGSAAKGTARAVRFQVGRN
jgi:hypothetical protein